MLYLRSTSPRSATTPSYQMCSSDFSGTPSLLVDYVQRLMSGSSPLSELSAS